jgi:hypothetical protein
MRGLWLCGCVSLLLGCGSSIDSLKQAVPTRQAVSVNVPAGASPGTTSVRSTEKVLLGQTATLYIATRNTSQSFNNGIASFLDGVEHIMSTPPSAHSADHAVWGPSNDALSSANYKFDVQQAGPGSYYYQFSGKPKGAPDSAYQVVARGTTHVNDPAHESGYLEVHNDIAHQLEPTSPPQDQTLIQAHFDSTADPSLLQIDLASTDATGASIPDAMYQYTQSGDSSGTFDFTTQMPVSGSLEWSNIVSRWLPTGQGRADVVGAGAMQFQIAECWDASFARTYYKDPNATEGDPASCAL